MTSLMLKRALSIVNGYLLRNYSNNELKVIKKELEVIINSDVYITNSSDTLYSYEEVQEVLSIINEKEDIRKVNGVYYTPTDIVKFIVFNSIKMLCNKLKPNNMHVQDLNGIPYSKFCFDKTIYDPTCGTGVFLIAALEIKLDLLDLHHPKVTKSMIRKVIDTINGNDLNEDSITITKIRLLLCIMHRYGVDKVVGLADRMNGCFTCLDFISNTIDGKKYDIIIGNPPYVEDSKSSSNPKNKYGNIYANVLENSALALNKNGVIGFVIPLSYVSTPRMKRIREKLRDYTSEQYILSYSDRPDCLFASVHQKLCVLLGKNTQNSNNIYTSNYRYWYKEEREELFNSTELIKNEFIQDDYIPKLGTRTDIEIYKKIINNKQQLMEMLEKKETPLYLNMRAAFWIKSFLKEHTGSEYKVFRCQNNEYANFCMCLLNSSLFWWYWICVSDCWHITNKELRGFRVPHIENFEITNKLATKLENELENTKLYVGTKQTEYEYKHKECTDLIHEIDDYINSLYNLTEEENIYIKNFSYRYRISGGTKNGRY